MKVFFYTVYFAVIRALAKLEIGLSSEDVNPLKMVSDY